MSKKRSEINPIRAERLKEILTNEKISQHKLADLIYQTQQNISRIMQLKQPLTEDTAQLIINAFPAYRIQWLLGYDNIPTVEEYNRSKQFSERSQARMIVLDEAVREVCAREGITPQPSINISEYIFLEAQLRDYANAIVLNCLKYRKYSHVWSLLDTDPGDH